MKKIYKTFFKASLVVGMLFTANSLFAQTYGENLVSKGDFEGEPAEIWSAWTKESSNQAFEKTEHITGAQSLRLTGKVNTSAVTQTIAVESGAKYVFGFSGRISDLVGPSGGDNTPSNELTYTVKENDDNGTVVGTPLVISSGTDQINVNGTFTVPEAVTKLFIHIGKNLGIGYVDDVYMKKVISDPTSLQYDKTQNPEFKFVGNGSYSLTSEDVISAVSLYNTSGQIVFSKKLSSNQTLLDLSSLKRGAYIVKVTLEAGVVFSLKTIL